MHVGSIIALPGAPETFVLEIRADQTIYIGRKAKSNLSSAEQCITLPYPEVSAKHAEIRCTENVWTIIDNGSTNGTTINNVPINPGKEYVLKDQDTVGIANYNLFISLPNQDTNNLAIQSEKELAAEQDKTHFQVKLINATILVADIKNFSTLMEEFAHDPSTVMQATGNVFNYLSKEIEKSEGRLEKIAGDAIMAYWTSKEKNIGAELSCHKACLTALHLKQIMITIAKDKKIWPFEKHPLAFDIALATGTVASGALGKSQGNPALLGDTANLAFRLEKLIADNESGKIIVDQNTYDLAKESFDFKHLGEYEIKGRHNLVNVYQLVRTLV